MGQKPIDLGSGAAEYKIKIILGGLILDISSQCSISIQTSQLIYNANQWAGFYKRGIGLYWL